MTRDVFVTVPIAKCVLYPNPSERSEQEIRDLAKDIGSRGMIHQPCARIVGKWNLFPFDREQFEYALEADEIKIEIGPGQTRFKAAELLGWTEITLKLVEMDDKQFQELMVSENLHRNDMHFLDVAEYFQSCVDKKEGIRKIATRHGFPESYVKKLLGLKGLGNVAKDWARKGAVNLEQAVALANTGEEFQESRFEKHLYETPVGPIYGEHPTKIYDAVHDDFDSIKDFKWDLKDEELYPEAGACNGCQKRSDAGSSLFTQWLGEKQTTDGWHGKKCLDRACQKVKKERYVSQVIAGLKSIHVDLEIVDYLAGHYDYSFYHEKCPEITFAANTWAQVQDFSKACGLHMVAGPAHPATDRHYEAGGKVLLFCTDPKCTVHLRYLGNTRTSGSDQESVPGMVIAAPLPAQDERRKLTKREVESEGKAAQKALLDTLDDCLSEDRLREDNTPLFIEEIWWEMFGVLGSSRELPISKVLLRVAKNQGFETFKISSYSWWNSLALKIATEIKLDEVKKWRDWIYRHQNWFIMAVMTEHKFQNSKLPEWAKSIWDVDYNEYLEAARENESVNLVDRRKKVKDMEDAEAALIEDVAKVFGGIPGTLYADENMDLLALAIHAGEEGLSKFTEADMRSLIKYLKGTAKRGATHGEMWVEIDVLVPVWRNRIKAAEQKKAIDKAVSEGHPLQCPNCDAKLSVDEIISSSCKRCEWPNNERPWSEIEAEKKAEEHAVEVAKVIADGGLEKCNNCGKQLDTDELLEQWCDDCDDSVGSDEEE